MRRALPAVLLLLAAAARAATPDAVRRRDVTIYVRVSGTVVSHDLFRLKSTIDGRVQQVFASTGAWSAAADPLATLAGTELAAMLDARGPQDQKVLEDRWGKIYSPTPIRCPSDCYVLRRYIRPMEWVRPQAVLFEAARGLKLVARVRAKDVRLLEHAGLTMTYWPVSDPDSRRTAPVTTLLSDEAGRGPADASFEVELSPRDYLPPGTDWSGVIVARIDRDILTVPSTALIKRNGSYYLPMLVSVGTAADGVTEILSGAEDGRPILLLDGAQLPGATLGGPPEAGEPVVVFDRPAPDEATAPAPAPAALDAAPESAPSPAPAAPAQQQDFGDDPYGR